MKTKAYPTEFKADGADLQFEGYASVFNNIDQGGDITMPGAFTKTISERGPAGSDKVKVLYQHDIWSPIGKPTMLEEDSKGLHFIAKIAPTALGKDVHILIKEGVIGEMSFGYDVIQNSYNQETNINSLLEMKLWEISPVTFPMNEAAEILGVKGVDDILERIKGVDHLLRMDFKEGRVLSKRNLTLIKSAYEALGELLSVDDDEKSGAKSKVEPGLENPDSTLPKDGSESPTSVDTLSEVLDAVGGSLKSLSAKRSYEKDMEHFRKSLGG